MLTSGLYYKRVKIVIYYCNNTILYYERVSSCSVALALARSVNYDCKAHCQLRRTFVTVNYDCNTVIVQAT